ncbi:MAG TPA: M56 family metallopeptidase, partial [Sumerlaeia bacterium]|nr:M56 family metallopeptidase [Sumerlaeia bacterium]
MSLGDGSWTWGFAARISALLVDAGAKGLVLLLAAGCVALVLRRSSAAARHLVWTLGMTGLLLLPALSCLLPAWSLPILPEELLQQTEAASGAIDIRGPGPAVAPSPQRAFAGPSLSAGTTPPGVAAAVDGAGLAASEDAATVSSPERFRDEAIAAPMPWWFWIGPVWLGGVLVVLIPHLLGAIFVWRLIRNARALEQTEALSIHPATPPRSRGENGVRFLETAGARMPMTWGVLRPTVLLPCEAASWPDDKRRAVLLHELAHVKRRDCLTQTLARLALALHWFDPLAWFALRRMRVERERACDDLVLGSGSRPSDYADHLLDIARTMRTGALASAAAVTMARRTQLEGRILAILNAAMNRRGLTRRSVAVALALAAAALLPLAAMQLSQRVNVNRAERGNERGAASVVENGNSEDEPQGTKSERDEARDEAAVRTVIQSYLAGVVRNDPDAVRALAAPKFRNSIVNWASPIPPEMLELFRETRVEHIVVYGDFALAITNPQERPDPKAKLDSGVLHFRLKKSQDQWLIDKIQRGPAEQVAKRIEEFENWARRQQGSVAIHQVGHGSLAIHHVRSAVDVTSMRAMEALDLQSLALDPTPLLTDKDIVSYDWDRHLVRLKPGVRERMMPKKPELRGIPFVVVANGERVYLGAFWPPESSFSHYCPVIYTLSFDLIQDDGSKIDNAFIIHPPMGLSHPPMVAPDPIDLTPHE